MTQSEHAGPRAAQAAQSTCSEWLITACSRTRTVDLFASVPPRSPDSVLELSGNDCAVGL